MSLGKKLAAPALLLAASIAGEANLSATEQPKQKEPNACAEIQGDARQRCQFLLKTLQNCFKLIPQVEQEVSDCFTVEKPGKEERLCWGGEATLPEVVAFSSAARKHCAIISRELGEIIGTENVPHQKGIIFEEVSGK